MNQKLTLEQKIQFFIDNEFEVELYNENIIILKQDYTDPSDPKITVKLSKTDRGFDLYLTDTVEDMINKGFVKIWKHLILKNI